jgi:DNA-binding FrmR family transcriptional regulator
MSDFTSPDQLRARLSRIEGQIRGIARMLETDRACEDVVTQLMAIRSGIDNVGALVLDTHLANCLGANEHGDQVEALRESMKLWWRFAPASGGLGAPDDAMDERVESTPDASGG